jgi:hypothetical protein
MKKIQATDYFNPHPASLLAVASGACDRLFELGKSLVFHGVRMGRAAPCLNGV